MKAETIERIRVLSQDFGLYDHEIGDIIGKHRVTVTRTRHQHNIPRPNLENREDKEQVCKKCGHVDRIKRRLRRRDYCDNCRRQSIADRKEKKRQYQRDYDKKRKDVLQTS